MELDDAQWQRTGHGTWNSAFETLTGDVALGAHLHLLYEGTLVVLTAGANPAVAAEAPRSVQFAMAAATANRAK